MQDSETQIFFDISELVTYIRHNSSYSGIQRVIAMVVYEMAARLPKDRLYVSYYNDVFSRHHCIRLDTFDTRQFLSPETAQTIFHGTKRRPNPASTLNKYRKKPLKMAFHRTKLDLAAMLGHDKAFRRYRVTPEEWRKFRTPPETEKVRQENFYDVAKPGDKMVLMDSAWNSKYIEAFTRVKEAGVEIHTLVHDLIPLVAPGTTGGKTPAIFNDWLSGATTYSHKFMANSKATHADLTEFLARKDISMDVPVLPLAQTGLPSVDAPTPEADAPDERKPDLSIYPELVDIIDIDADVRALTLTPYVLCVGTIEARKNLWRLAAAWKHLVDQGHVDIPRLVIAGRLGFARDTMMQLLESTGNIYGYATVLEGPSDEELDFLYKKCLFGTMPSLIEGWGLPVGEFLSYGKTAVVSHSSSLPEVGGDLVRYCDPHSVQSIADAILDMAQDADGRRALEDKIKATHLRSWSDVAQDLTEILR